MAIRNAGESADMEVIKLNNIAAGGQSSALKSRATHSRDRRASFSKPRVISPLSVFVWYWLFLTSLKLHSK